MKTTLSLLSLFCLSSSQGFSQGVTYQNFIRQVQYPSQIYWDINVEASGTRTSAMEINPGGARFELHTVQTNGNDLTSYLLREQTVGAYVPMATVKIISKDPHVPNRRTRVDEPFFLEIEVSGIYKPDPLLSQASYEVTYLRHAKAYGEGSAPIDWAQASLISKAKITENFKQTFDYTNRVAVPSQNLAKTYGQERFAIYTVEDKRGLTYLVPPSQLISETIDILPVSDGRITGVVENKVYKHSLPSVTYTANDVYPGPDSTLFLQVYPGEPVLDTKGTEFAHKPMSYPGPQDFTYTEDKWGQYITGSGRWTIELIERTVYGDSRLHTVTFDIDRTLEVRSTLTTNE